MKDADNTLVNRRKIVGPVELLDGDTIEIGTTSIKFTLKDAC
ncbi:FHA domain-containing protein [bacterium]|nr:FHA domain-containing protein [bacterium]